MGVMLHGIWQATFEKLESAREKASLEVRQQFGRGKEAQLWSRASRVQGKREKSEPGSWIAIQLRSSVGGVTAPEVPCTLRIPSLVLQIRFQVCRWDVVLSVFSSI